MSMYMERKLVSKSVPIVHRDTTPRLESFQVNIFEGAVAAKVVGAPAFGALFGLCDLAANKCFITYFFPANVLTVSILGPLLVLVALLLGLWEYLLQGYLLSFSPWDMVFHVLFNAFERVGFLKGTHPLYLLDFLKAQLEL
jgi:hypothetical protein